MVKRVIFNKLGSEILKITLKLSVAGILIGLLHEYDLLIALLLLSYIVWKLKVEVFKKDHQNYVLLIGMIITGIIGVTAENWGIRNHFWIYHNLSNNRVFPYWLPFAWALAFYLIYKIEKSILTYVRPKNIAYKIMIFVLVALIFPVLGEIVTINLGVWTYTWPYQFFGVPLVAVLLLILLHTFVNSIFLIICNRFNIYDRVFTID